MKRESPPDLILGQSADRNLEARRAPAAAIEERATGERKMESDCGASKPVINTCGDLLIFYPIWGDCRRRGNRLRLPVCFP